MIVWCGNLTILLSGLTFHCFWYRKQKTLCDSLHRPSRSDFVQFRFSFAENKHLMIKKKNRKCIKSEKNKPFQRKIELPDRNKEGKIISNIKKWGKI